MHIVQRILGDESKRLSFFVIVPMTNPITAILDCPALRAHTGYIPLIFLVDWLHNILRSDLVIDKLAFFGVNRTKIIFCDIELLD